MKEDRHLKVIEKSITHNIPKPQDTYLEYTFEDGTNIIGNLGHDYEMELVREHGYIVEIKKKESV